MSALPADEPDSRGRIVIPGGRGFLGAELTRHFRERQYEVTVLSRTAEPDSVTWDGIVLDPDVLKGAVAVINLAGRPIDVRWTEENRRAILDSRVNATRAVGEALLRCEHPPGVWLNASGVGYYGDTDREVDEFAPAGEGFVADVAKQWEAAVDEWLLPHVRRVKLRISTILGRNGGAFPVLAKLTRAYLGSALGSGRQYMAWMHVHDFCRAVEKCLNGEEAGPVNLCAPDPVPNAEFMCELRRAYRRPAVPPVPAPLLKLATLFGAPEPDLVLSSTRALPGILTREAFAFEYASLRDAVADLTGPARTTRA